MILTQADARIAPELIPSTCCSQLLFFHSRLLSKTKPRYRVDAGLWEGGGGSVCDLVAEIGHPKELLEC